MRRIRNATIGGARIAPTADPLLKSPARQRALLFREPLRHHLHRARPVARLADPQQEAEHAETERAARERVQRRRDGPPRDAQSVAQARAQAVDHRARERRS